MDKAMTDSIHPDTNLGPVHLTVSDLERAVAFYRDVIGCKELSREGMRAVLTTDGITPLIILTGRPGARPKPARSTGLYHFAILVPSRTDLAHALRRLAESNHPLQGAADHLVSEALYLADPDGNGLEIYADRPRSSWQYQNGTLLISTEPLDLEGLLAEAAQAGQSLPAATRIGHIHLHVSDLDEAERFYHQVLGFDIVTRYGPSASFLSAGGYHHHIGVNTWAGRGAPPPPEDAVGLRSFTICLPGPDELERVEGGLQAAGISFAREDRNLRLHDPSHNPILIFAEGLAPVIP